MAVFGIAVVALTGARGPHGASEDGLSGGIRGDHHVGLDCRPTLGERGPYAQLHLQAQA